MICCSGARRYNKVAEDEGSTARMLTRSFGMQSQYRFAEAFEWVATYILLWPVDGVMKKDDIRRVFDVSGRYRGPFSFCGALTLCCKPGRALSSSRFVTRGSRKGNRHIRSRRTTSVTLLEPAIADE